MIIKSENKSAYWTNYFSNVRNVNLLAMAVNDTLLLLMSYVIFMYFYLCVN